MWAASLVVGSLLVTSTRSLVYDLDQLDWNLNQDAEAVHPLDYWGEWDNHTYNPSPENWRFPFYTMFLDKFVNGDPTNDDANVSDHSSIAPQINRE